MPKLSFLSFVLLISISLAGPAYALSGVYDIDGYAGLDAKIRKMPFKKNFGSHVFSDSEYDELNGFLGFKINESLGIETGYEFSERKLQSKIAKNGSILFGAPLFDYINGFDSITHFIHATSKIKGFNINLVGFLPINDEKSISLIGSTGFGYLNSHNTCHLYATGETGIKLLDGEEIPVQRMHLSRSKYKNSIATLRIQGGLQYVSIKHNFGVRTMIGLENTHKIKIHGLDSETMKKVNEYAKFNDSLIFRVGFFVPF